MGSCTDAAGTGRAPRGARSLLLGHAQTVSLVPVGQSVARHQRNALGVVRFQTLLASTVHVCFRGITVTSVKLRGTALGPMQSCDRPQHMSALQRLWPFSAAMGADNQCQQSFAEVGIDQKRWSTFAGAADQLLTVAVDYGAATAFFFLTTEGRDGKHSKRRSAYAKPVRLTASASK